jgi:hypothetical protein
VKAVSGKRRKMGFHGYFTVPQDHYIVHAEFPVLKVQQKIKKSARGDAQFFGTRAFFKVCFHTKDIIQAFSYVKLLVSL